MTRITMEGFKVIPVRRGFLEIQDLYESIQQFDGMIAGGYVRYMASLKQNPERAGDVDIFAKDEDSFNAMKKFFTEECSMEVRFENPMAITYERPEEGGRFEFAPTIQLIKPVQKGAIVASGSLDMILDNFDFTIVRIGLLSPTEILADEGFEEDEKKGLLRLKNIHCPVSSMMRCLKYVRKGYFLRPAEAMKLFIDWDNRDDDYRANLIRLFDLSNLGNISEEEINELEVLLRID